MKVKADTNLTEKQFTSDGPNEYTLQILSSNQVEAVLWDLQNNSLNTASVLQFKSSRDQLLIL